MRDLVVSSSVLILFVIMMRIIFRRRIGHRLRYALWLIVAVRLALPFTLPGSPVSIMNFVPRMQQMWGGEVAVWQDKSVQNESGPEESAPNESWRSGAVPDTAAADNLTGEGAGGAMKLMIQPGAAEIRNSGSTAETGMMPQKAAPDVTGIPKFLRILPAVWLAGVVCIGSYLLIINLIVWRRLYRTRVPVKLDELAWEGGKPAVYCCEKLVSPCLFGLFRPAIYLNGKALADQQGCFYAMAHERRHYCHKDHIWSFVRLLLVTIYWFHPLVWMAAVLSARDCELACDEGVTARITEEECAQYGRALLDQIPPKRRGLHVTVSTSMSGGARQLRQRLLAITHRRKTSAGAVLFTAALLLLITGCTFTGADGTPSNMGKNSADPLSVEGGNGESGPDGAGAQESDMEGADTEGSGAQGPAQPVSADSELLLKLEESIRVDEDGELAFTIPASDHAPEDWTFSFRGKRNDGSDWETGDSFHIVDSVKGESAGQDQTMDCIMNIVPFDFSELSMTVTLSSFAADGEEIRTAVMIELLTEEQEVPEQGETPENTMQTILNAYTMFPDGKHGWALTKNHQILYTYEGEDQFSLAGSLPFAAEIRNADGAGDTSDAENEACFLADNGIDISSCFLDEKTAYFAGVSANEGEALLIRLQILSEPAAGDEDGQILVSEHRTRIPLQEYYWCGNVYVSFADAQNGYLLVCSDPALGQMAKHLYRTTDGGDSFSFVADLSTVIKGYPGGMAFCDENTGYIGVSIRGDSSNYLYGTPDGGLTWERVEVPVHADAYYVDAPVPVVFHEDGEVQMAIVLRNVVGQSDRYVLYENPNPADFRSWQLIEILPYEEVKGYHLSDRNTGYFIDGSGTLHKWEYDAP